MKKFIVVKLQFEALHNWPNCDVIGAEFLKFPHRHMFHVKAVKEVSHNDRDIEIIVFKRSILNFLDGLGSNINGSKDLGPRSCEDLAETLINEFDLYSCEVLEDNENGAYLIKGDLND